MNDGGRSRGCDFVIVRMYRCRCHMRSREKGAITAVSRLGHLFLGYIAARIADTGSCGVRSGTRIRMPSPAVRSDADRDTMPLAFMPDGTARPFHDWQEEAAQ